MPELTARMEHLPSYPLTWVPQKKRELIARGVDVIDLGAGDADLAPPPAAVEALARAAHDPAMSRYGFGIGLPAFREAVATWMERRFGARFDPATEIVPLIGSKEGLAHLAFAYVNPGDTVIVPEPAYAPYVGGTVLADGTAHRVPLREENGYLLDLDEVPKDVLKRSTVVYLNYPNNPTGAIAPREYLERTVARCREHDLLLVYDNAYSELAYDGYRPPGIFEIDGAREVAIEFHSFSKTYNMTGWRCGWAVARPDVCAALAKVKTFVDTGAFMAVQAAGVAALESWAEFVPANVEVFRRRRDAAVEAFRGAGFTCDVPRAAMYLWLRLPDGLSDDEFAKRLLLEEGVVVMPGSSFGSSGTGYFRVSFITSPERLAEAARRAGRVLSAAVATTA
ncbi:MAG TPA: aminotransferase class I/II-fold pyridoxal phosphate-dependent enzyme [Gemmatimonadaceae bacterium]|nr:aminotransferase class I/II-fold pyridoxal phosphate-dependent enzyme [Gemmatimonadaceae bacterium]